MSPVPEAVEAFLSGKRIVVAGVSRDPHQPANAIFHKFHDAGYEVMAVNPYAQEIEGFHCYPNLAAVPGQVDGVMAVTHSKAAVDIVRQCADRGVRTIWFHKALGEGSVSAEAMKECETRGIRYIANGCPLMYVQPVDPGHKFLRWVLKWFRGVPG